MGFCTGTQFSTLKLFSSQVKNRIIKYFGILQIISIAFFQQIRPTEKQASQNS